MQCVGADSLGFGISRRRLRINSRFALSFGGCSIFWETLHVKLAAFGLWFMSSSATAKLFHCSGTCNRLLNCRQRCHSSELRRYRQCGFVWAGIERGVKFWERAPRERLLTVDKYSWLVLDFQPLFCIVSPMSWCSEEGPLTFKRFFLTGGSQLLLKYASAPLQVDVLFSAKIKQESCSVPFSLDCRRVPVIVGLPPV